MHIIYHTAMGSNGLFLFTPSNGARIDVSHRDFIVLRDTTIDPTHQAQRQAISDALDYFCTALRLQRTAYAIDDHDMHNAHTLLPHGEVRHAFPVRSREHQPTLDAIAISPNAPSDGYFRLTAFDHLQRVRKHGHIPLFFD